MPILFNDLEFFRTNDREDQINDQTDRDDANNQVFHFGVGVFLDVVQTLSHAHMKRSIRPKKPRVARMYRMSVMVG